MLLCCLVAAAVRRLPAMQRLPPGDHSQRACAGEHALTALTAPAEEEALLLLASFPQAKRGRFLFHSSQTHAHTRACALARLPFCCETSDAPGSWAPAPPRWPNRCKTTHANQHARTAAGLHARLLQRGHVSDALRAYEGAVHEDALQRAALQRAALLARIEVRVRALGFWFRAPHPALASLPPCPLGVRAAPPRQLPACLHPSCPKP